MKQFFKRFIIKTCFLAILLVSLKTYTDMIVKADAISTSSLEKAESKSKSQKVETKVSTETDEESQAQLEKGLLQAHYDRWCEVEYDFANVDYIYDSLTYPLAKIIYAEVGGIHQTKIQQYTGYVFINLMNSKYYPNTVEGVLKQCYAEETNQKFQKNECSEEALENAKVVVNNYYNGTMPVSSAMIYQAEFEQGVNRFKIENEWFGYDQRILNDLKSNL